MTPHAEDRDSTLATAGLVTEEQAMSCGCGSACKCGPGCTCRPGAACTPSCTCNA